jgi:hypothetical protein
MVTSYWGPNDMRLSHLAIAALLTAGAASAAASVLVVRATGPSAKAYPAGKQLPDTARITLQANDTLVLLDQRGTRTLRGPGTFTPTGPAGTQMAAAAPQRRARIGAVRNAGVVPRSPTLWHVDVTQSSTVCVADASNVTLWRPEAGETVTLSIQPAAGAPQRVEWPAGQATLAWPSALRLQEGSEYRLSWDGNSDPTRLRFKTLRSQPADVQEVASALIENGCEAQLDLLIETQQQAS